MGELIDINDVATHKNRKHGGSNGGDGGSPGIGERVARLEVMANHQQKSLDNVQASLNSQTSAISSLEVSVSKHSVTIDANHALLLSKVDDLGGQIKLTNKIMLTSLVGAFFTVLVALVKHLFFS